jgi:DNA polymerase-1
MAADQQEDLYRNLMMPSQKTIIQMELVGMPMIPKQIDAAQKELETIVNEQDDLIANSPLIAKYEMRLQREAMVKANAKLKTKQHPIQKFAHLRFNPNSNPQLQAMLYEDWDLPVIDVTKTRAPAVGAETLEKLVNHTTDPEKQGLLHAFIMRGKANKILSTFIPAFMDGVDKHDGRLWLHGSFNLGGTVSGRLSSSEPNLQNLPSGSKYGKLVKSIFAAPDGFIFCGADFSSLEDRINALLTKDPNKLKVYVDGYDGHCLRTYSYWPEEFKHLTDSPEDVNSIADTHKDLRGKSKGPTFALTYLGTWSTLVNNAGFTEDEAKRIEANYHNLYGVSTQWVKDRIADAGKQGYAEAAFGLRIRTPLLARTYLGKSSTPREAEAEGRTLGNAISGQSYGLLCNRAANAVMKRVWASKYRYDILPVSLIHDAIYFIVKDDVDIVAWLNEVLIEEMSWQELPEIQHGLVKLGANLGLFYPNWANEIELPNHATEQEIRQKCMDSIEALTPDNMAA